MIDDPEQRLTELTDLATPFAVRVVATLRIPDLIESGTRDLDGLAAATGADPQALGRLLRYLVHREVFTEPREGVFGLTATGRLLRDSGTAGRRSRLDLTSIGARMDLAYGGLLHSIRTGEPGYAVVHGRSLWADLEDSPEDRSYFDELMLLQQRRTAPQVARLYAWDGVRRVVDIGGGNGGLLAELLSTHAHLRGTLVDLPGPTERTSALFDSAGVADRAEVVAGDFFGALPPGGDVYVISRVLSDWGDKEATAILRRCREAAGDGGRVLIIEVLPAEPLSPFDLKMLVVVGGRERSAAEFEALAANAGLAVTSVEHGEDGLVLIECTPRPDRP